MKKWITTPPSAREDVTKPRKNSRDSLTTVLEENSENINPREKLEDEKSFYEHLERYRELPPPPPSDSQGDYAASSPSIPSVPSEYSYEDPYCEIGMFSGPVTDLDEDSDPDEIKIYNPATKSVTIKRRPQGNNSVNVNINVNLSHLEQDIQRMIDEMANLDVDGSVRSNSTRPDSGIEGSQEGNCAIERETGECQRAAVPPPGSYGARNRRLFWNGSNKWSVERGHGEKDIKNVTCLVNENFDESRVFKSSVNGLPLGMATATGSLGPPKQATDWRSRGRGSLKRVRRRNLAPVTPRRHEGRKICCNVFTLTLAMLLVSTTYFSVANVQTTLRWELDLGRMALITEGASRLICVLFIPTIVTRWPGRKWGAVLGALLSLAWPAMQLLPPGQPELFSAAAVAAAAQGLASALLWGSALPLVCEMTESRGDAAITLSLGALLSAWQLGQMGAGVVTTAVMVQHNEWLPAQNNSPCMLDRCSAPAPADARELLDSLHSTWLPLLAGPLLAAMLVAAALRPPKRAECMLDAGGPGGRHGLLHPLRHFGGCRQLLLVPSSALSGMLDAFLTADFTKEISGCSWGGARATAGPAVAGFSHAVAVLLLAPLAAQSRGRAPVAALCAVFLGAGGAALACPWATAPSDPVRLLLPAALAGAGASLDVLAAAAAALTFPERRAMACSFLLAARAGGALLLLAFPEAVCLEVKLLVLAGALLVASTSTAALERLWGAGAPPPAQGLPPPEDHGAADEDGMVEVPLDRPRHW